MIQLRIMQRPRRLKHSLVLAGASITIIPLLVDLCQGPTHHGAPALLLPAAYAGQDDLFAETPQQVAADLESCFKNAEAAIAGCDIRTARQRLSFANLSIEKHKKVLDRDQKKDYKNRLAALNATLKRTIDSLVKVNVEIVGKKGQKAGYEFRQMLSGQKGLSETDLAPVDAAIVERGNYDETESQPPESSPATVPPFTPPQPPLPPPAAEQQTPAPSEVSSQKESTPKEDKKNKKFFRFSLFQSKEEPGPEEKAPPTPGSRPAPAPALAAPVPAPAPAPQAVPVPVPAPAPAVVPAPAPTSAPVIAPAPQETKPAQANPQEEKDRSAAVSHATKVRSLLDAGKIEEAKTVFHIYNQQIQRYLEGDLYAGLKAAVDTATVQDQKQQAGALSKAKEIEKLLDANRIAEAFTEHRKSQGLLKQYMDKEEFKALDKRVSQAYMGFVQNQLAANQTMRSIRDLLDEKEVDKAFASFDSHQAELKTGLSRESFESLRRDVVAANEAILDKKKRCEFISRDITSLMRAGNGPGAYALFNENATLLRQYLDPARVSGLATDVNRSQEAYYERQKKARAMAAAIDSLLDRPKPEEAHALFEDSKDKLRTDLAEDKRFFELRDRVNTAWNDLQKQRRSAARTAQEVESLIKSREGRKAYDLFQQESPALRKYTAPDLFSKLENAVAQANADYSLRSQAAQRTANEIATLLDNKNVEQAYAKYRNAENDLDFYLGSDKSVDALGKQVRQAYKALQDRKQWAADQVKEIRRLIEKQKGRAAREQYVEQRGELAKYIDGHTLDALATETTRANRDFEAAADRARQQMTRVLAFLSQGQVEEAQTAFNTAESTLRFYLEPADFASLQSRVEASSSALKGKKSEALRIVKAMDRYIDAKKGDSALLIFRQNEGTLSAYLNTATYKQAESRAEAAKNDFEKKHKDAETLEDKLYSQINRDRVQETNETFKDRRDFLETYLEPSRFERLRTAVAASYDAFTTDRKKARAVASAIKQLVKRHQGVEAHSELNIRESQLCRYLPSDEYLDIVAAVTKEYNSTLQGRKEARETAAAIHELIAKEEFAYAYSTFREMKSNLELYMPENDFTALESEVTYASGEQEKRVRQAKEYAKSLKQMVAKDRIEDAYKAFRQHREALEKYLDAESFSDLESTIVGAYKKSSARGRGNG